MLFFGNEKDEVINIGISNNMIIYTLASFREGFNKLSIMPPNELGRFENRDFDIIYADYIINNDIIFINFFQIIYNLYIGKDVLIIYSEEFNFSENIIESVLKLIQQRYGYNAIRIDNDDDFIYAKNNNNPYFAPGYGLYNLDTDKERFTYMIEKYRLSTINENNPVGIIPFNLEGFIIND